MNPSCRKCVWFSDCTVWMILHLVSLNIYMLHQLVFFFFFFHHLKDNTECCATSLVISKTKSSQHVSWARQSKKAVAVYEIWGKEVVFQQVEWSDKALISVKEKTDILSSLTLPWRDVLLFDIYWFIFFQMLMIT